MVYALVELRGNISGKKEQFGQGRWKIVDRPIKARANRQVADQRRKVIDWLIEPTVERNRHEALWQIIHGLIEFWWQNQLCQRSRQIVESEGVRGPRIPLVFEGEGLQV